MKEEIPLVYLFLHLKFRKTIANAFTPMISPKEARRIIRNTIRIPYSSHYAILSQMEEYGLIRWVNHIRYDVEESRNCSCPLCGRKARKVKNAIEIFLNKKIEEKEKKLQEAPFWEAA